MPAPAWLIIAMPDSALLIQPEASVYVRGLVKYVVMINDQYQHFRECELEAAVAESRADLEAGRFVKETVLQHIQRIQQMNALAAWVGS